MSSSNCLSRKKVLIIGGSSGVGYGVAEAALRSGAQVFIASSTEAKVRAAVNDLRSSTDEQEASIFGRTVDVSSGADLDNLVSWMKAMGNGEDIAHFVYTSGDNLSILPFLEIDIDVAKTVSLLDVDSEYWLIINPYLSGDERSVLGLPADHPGGVPTYEESGKGGKYYSHLR